MRLGARAPFRERARWCAVVAILAVTTPSLAAAQRRSQTITIARARSTFESMESAYRELRSLDAQPADTNGAVAGWDRRWARSADRAERDAIRVCLDVLADELREPRNCELRERSALFCNVGFIVSTARRAIYEDIPEGDTDEFDARRAIADEAARRRAEHLSCEDLPAEYEVFQDDCGRWYTHDGLPLVPGSPPPVSTGIASGCSDSGSVSPDTTQPLSREVIAAVVRRQRPDLALCVVAALGGVSPVPNIQLDISLAIDTSGAVTSAAVTGEGAGTLTDCVERTALGWRFPAAGAPSTANFAVSFSAADTEVPRR